MHKKDNNLIFIVKKTNDLTDQEIDQLLLLHNTTMSAKRTKKMLQDKYSLNFLGFSFHGLMESDGKIIGCYNVIPYEFVLFSKKTTTELRFGLKTEPNRKKPVFSVEKKS